MVLPENVVLAENPIVEVQIYQSTDTHEQNLNLLKIGHPRSTWVLNIDETSNDPKRLYKMGDQIEQGVTQNMKENYGWTNSFPLLTN